MEESGRLQNEIMVLDRGVYSHLIIILFVRQSSVMAHKWKILVLVILPLVVRNCRKDLLPWVIFLQCYFDVIKLSSTWFFACSKITLMVNRFYACICNRFETLNKPATCVLCQLTYAVSTKKWIN